MQNFSAIRSVVQRQFRKDSWGVAPPLHWRGLKRSKSTSTCKKKHTHLRKTIPHASVLRKYHVLLPFLGIRVQRKAQTSKNPMFARQVEPRKPDPKIACDPPDINHIASASWGVMNGVAGQGIERYLEVPDRKKCVLNI